GEIEAERGLIILVESREYIFVSSSNRTEYVIEIDVRDSQTVQRAILSYDEIDPLIKAIDFMAALKRSATKLGEPSVEYSLSSKGLVVGLTPENDESLSRVYVRCGVQTQLTASFSRLHLFDFEKLLIKAKQKLDSIKK